jgi:Flp pilus assembly protein TadG
MRFTCDRLRTLAETCRLLLGTGGERGAEIVEFAFVAPLLITLVLGIFWVGRAFNTYQTLTRAAREGARVAAAATCASCGNTPPNVTDVENAVLNSLSASLMNTDNVQVPASCSGSLSAKICYERDVALDSGDTDGESGVVVGLSYPASFPIPFVKISPITLTAQVQMRQEN